MLKSSPIPPLALSAAASSNNNTTCTRSNHQKGGRHLLLLLFAATAASFASANEVVTNQFHVVVKREASGSHPGGPRALADQIARETGFHNLGPVSQD